MRPDIVLILIDDSRWKDFGRTVSDFYRAPHESNSIEENVQSQERLGRLGIEQHALLVFTSDNAGLAFDARTR